MRNFLLSTVFLSSLMLCSSCASLQQGGRLSDHKSQLKKAAGLNENPQEQMDVLLTSLVKMMSESLDFVDPKQGVKFINKYKNQNEKSITSIMSNLEAWMGNMNTVDKMSTVIALIKEENVQQFMALVPKFEKKYKQIQFFTKMSERLKGLFFSK